MQKCSRCLKAINDGDEVYMKCPGIYEYFSESVHRAIPQDVEDLWHVDCDDDD